MDAVQRPVEEHHRRRLGQRGQSPRRLERLARLTDKARQRRVVPLLRPLVPSGRGHVQPADERKRLGEHLAERPRLREDEQLNHR